MNAIEAGQLASTTLKQINEGDFWARARWGVKGTSVAEDGTLILRCLRGFYISVTLDTTDLYTVKIHKLKGGRNLHVVELAKREGVEVSTLVRTIDGMFNQVAK